MRFAAPLKARRGSRRWFFMRCLCARPSACDSVDRGAVAGLGNGLAFGAACFEPGCLGDLDFTQRLLWRPSEGRTRFQIRNVCDIAAVVLAVKHVNMVIAHRSTLSSSIGILPHPAGIVESGTASLVRELPECSVAGLLGDAHRYDGCLECELCGIRMPLRPCR